MWGVIEKTIHGLVKVVAVIGTFILFPMLLLTTFDVIGRSIFNSPIQGTYELSQFLLVVISLFGIGYVQQRNAQVRVDMFLNMMPEKVKLVMEIIFTILGLCFFALVVWQGVLGTLHAFDQGETSPMLAIPSYPFHLLIPFGSFLLCLELIVKLVNILTNRQLQVAKTEVLS